MTRQKPALHASRIFADPDESVATRLKELAFETQNAYIQSLRDSMSKLEVANEEALVGRTQELALDSQKTPSQPHSLQIAAGRALEFQNRRKAIAHAQAHELALLGQNGLGEPYKHGFAKMRALANNAVKEEARRNAQAYTEPRLASPPSPSTSSPSSEPARDFELVPAVYEDIPTLVQIHIDAYIYDQLTQLLRRGTDPEKYKRWLTEMVQRSWDKTSKDTWILVAKRKSDGEALGCAVYQIHDKPGEKTVHEEIGAEGEKTMEGLTAMLRWGVGGAGISKEKIGRAEDELWSQDETPAPPKGKSLEEVARAGMMAMHERWVPAGTRYMYLGSLAVSSQHQSHGVGGALLHAGMSRADTEGLLIWLEATPAGHPVYEHYGWKTVDSSSVRLQDFAGPRGEQAGWGVYRASGCLRMPMLVEKGKEKEKEDEHKREDEEVGKKKREDEKWWTDEYERMHRDRKLRKEKEMGRRTALRESRSEAEKENRNALRELRRQEAKTEASKRFSERRNEKRMSREMEFQREEAEEESHSWGRYRERLDERRSASGSRTSGVASLKQDQHWPTLSEIDMEIWQNMTENGRKAAEEQEQRAMERKAWEVFLGEESEAREIWDKANGNRVFRHRDGV